MRSDSRGGSQLSRYRVPQVSPFSRPGIWPIPQAQRETLWPYYFIGEKSVGRMYVESTFSTVFSVCSDFTTA